MPAVTAVAVDASGTIRLVKERGTLRSFQLAMVRAKAFRDGEQTEALGLGGIHRPGCFGQGPGHLISSLPRRGICSICEGCRWFVIFQGGGEFEFCPDIYQPWKRIFVHSLGKVYSLL
jgi:hypothetical protein